MHWDGIYHSIIFMKQDLSNKKNAAVNVDAVTLKKIYITIAIIAVVFGALGTVGGNLIYAGRYAQKIDSIELTLSEHRQNENVHMPLKDKIQLFLTRTEFDNYEKQHLELHKQSLRELNQIEDMIKRLK